jgi:hypothetical protein
MVSDQWSVVSSYKFSHTEHLTFVQTRRQSLQRGEPPFGFGGSQSTGTAKTATPSPQRAGSLIASVRQLTTNK